ncbi:MAG TPA: peptide chain release factor N(5)-glutamine methyltransferase, partial [Candidatus Dormibacteraeota bacterium]|nr:peptide chain release factor N(5)-glutamine methyltransferase [Candidatus Dormibacteraeota bacterium]
MTAAALLGAATDRLAAAGIDTARLDAEVLLAHALGVGRAGLYAR